MADLKLDFAELRQSARTAERIAADFAGAERIAAQTAAATGHERLAATVREFGDKWDIARGELQENLRLVSDYLGAVIDTFTDLDTDLAAATKGDR